MPEELFFLMVDPEIYTGQTPSVEVSHSPDNSVRQGRQAQFLALVSYGAASEIRPLTGSD
jgi:hypothetical protein